MRSIAVLAGVAAGMVLAEIGLRLVFLEHEANRNYWGRGAFIEDEALGYRHAPLACSTVGRFKGPFPAHEIRFNAEGYRCRRPRGDGSEQAIRVALVGASNLVGVGISDDGQVLHERLEVRLQEGYPARDVRVFNISQTGYVAWQLVQLANRALREYRPDVVALVISDRAIDKNSLRFDVDIVNGYRLPRQRPLPDSWLDAVRTRSFLYSRTITSPVLKWTTLRSEISQLSFVQALRGPQSRAPAKSSLDAIAEDIVEFDRAVADANVSLVVLLYGTDPMNHIATHLSRANVWTRVLPIESLQLWEGDNHWTPADHDIVAEAIADAIRNSPGWASTR
jgi:hypothetical protein